MNEAVEVYLLAKAVTEHSIDCSGINNSCRFCYSFEDLQGTIDHEKGCPVLIARKYVAN